MTAAALGWRDQAQLVATVLRNEAGSVVQGVYIHGSAALGGWTSASDLDILIIADGSSVNWASVGRHLVSVLAPDPIVELSAVSVSAAAHPKPPWPFILHVNQGEARVVTDDGAGDPDLLMHFVVARHCGIALVGPPASVMFGIVPKETVVAYLRDELAWGTAEADQRYAVLNACRALAYSCDGSVLSKVDGGKWALDHGYDAALIASALDAQAAGRDLGPSTSATKTFVHECIALLSAPPDND